jgi:hypothetical protein
MKRKCRKVTAAFLSCILAFICVTAELSHHHNSPEVSLQPQSSQPQNGAGQAQAGHDLFCAACAFALAHVAPVISAQHSFAEPVVAMAPAITFVFHNTIPAFSLGLRAPPADLA